MKPYVIKTAAHAPKHTYKKRPIETRLVFPVKSLDIADKQSD